MLLNSNFDIVSFKAFIPFSSSFEFILALFPSSLIKSILLLILSWLSEYISAFKVDIKRIIQVNNY